MDNPDQAKSLYAKFHFYLFALAATILILALVFVAGMNHELKKLKADTSVVVEVTVVHDTLYSKAKTIALTARNAPTDSSAAPIASIDTSKLPATVDSLRGYIVDRMTPFWGYGIDSILATSRTGQDTIALFFRIDARADPQARVIEPLTLALAPFDMPKTTVMEKSTVFEGYPWYRQAVPFGLGVAGSGAAIWAGAKAPAVALIGLVCFGIGELSNLL